MFWVISVYFNIRNTLPKFCPFLLGHSVYAVRGKSARNISGGGDKLVGIALDAVLSKEYVVLNAHATKIILYVRGGK